MPEITLPSETPSTEAPSAETLDQIIASVNVAQATTRCAMKEIHDTRSQLKRTEACLALLLGALSEFREGASDYVVHRIAQELRRLAVAPETAAALAGCSEDDIDPPLLQAIASHLYGARAETIWQVQPVNLAVMH
jgi:hypothetical protein